MLFPALILSLAVDAADTVSFSSEDGRIINSEDFQVTASSTESRQNNIDLYKVDLFMSESLTESNILTNVRYPRQYKSEIQTNFREIVDPQVVAKYDRDFTYFFTGFTRLAPVIILKNTGSLAQLTEEDVIWVQKTETDAISTLPIIGETPTSWKPRINTGSFVIRDVPTGWGSKDVEYFIPDVTGYPVAVNWAEGYDAPAASGTPYLSKAHREAVYVVDPYTLQLPRKNLFFWDGDWGSGALGGSWVDNTNTYPTYDIPNIIDAPDVTGVPSDPKWSHGINIYVRDQLMDNENIFGWNKRNGIIKLLRPISPGSKVTSTYLYEQKEIELNLDVNPNLGHEYVDRVTDTLRVVLKPNWATYANDTSDPDSSGDRLAWHWLSDNPAGVYHYDWTTGSGTTGFTFSDNRLVGLPEQTLVIGDYSIGQDTPNAANLIDTRVRGGGIKEDGWFTQRRTLDHPSFQSSPTARRQAQIESEYYWDIGHLDGEPYQADGTLIISIPSSVRNDIESRIVDDQAGETNITSDDRIFADSIFVSSGNYDLDVILSGIASESRVKSIKRYVQVVETARESALSEIRGKIDKHVALGEFYVIVDETSSVLDRGNTPTHASKFVSGGSRRSAFLNRNPEALALGGGDGSKEPPTAMRDSFPETQNKSSKAREL